MGEAPVRVPQRRVRGPAVVPPLALDPGMWLNMVNVKPPYLADLEIESMKKFVLDYKRYSRKCPRQLLLNMWQFILEEHLDIIVSESGRKIDEVMHLERDDFIGIMLRVHQANSSRKWRLMVKNAKWKNPISLYRLLCNILRISDFGLTLLGELIGCLTKKWKKCFSLG